MAISLIVKGSPNDAVQAAARNGISELKLIRTKPEWTLARTLASCPSEFAHEVRAWFLVDFASQAPFEPGSLLHYTDRQCGNHNLEF